LSSAVEIAEDSDLLFSLPGTSAPVPGFLGGAVSPPPGSKPSRKLPFLSPAFSHSSDT